MVVFKDTYCHTLSFNSQRDGILLCCRKNLRQESESFNSQRDGILRLQLLGVAWAVNGFNSQRDGILHNRLFHRPMS